LKALSEAANGEADDQTRQEMDLAIAAVKKRKAAAAQAAKKKAAEKAAAAPASPSGKK